MQKDKASAYLDMELLRFTTAGSVDDGKSTLIGRLLYDSKAIFEDQLTAIELSSKRKGEEFVNLALLTDGLRAEREQGITIDVAYRYFATPKRKFIIADTPGHIQYTRNMVTGASTANLAIILIDARHGVLEQTLRHAYIASLLQIPHLVVCVNKMDLVDFKEDVFNTIKEHFLTFKTKLNIKDVRFVPISAKDGDNVVNKSEKTPWYSGTPLLELLENIDIDSDINKTDARLPVQYVIRPQSDEFHDYRGYAGRLASGVFKVGDAVTHLPSGLTSKVKSLDFYKDTYIEVFAPQAIVMTIEDNIDISRGDIIVKSDNQPQKSQDIEAMVCWFNEKPLRLRGKYVVRHTTADVKCIVNEVVFKMDINTLTKNEEDKTVAMNDIACIKFRTTKPLLYDSYNTNRITGSLVLIDEGTNETVGACMLL